MTSIEWLVEQLKDYDFSPRENTYLIEIPLWIWTEKFEEAKEMHRAEIIKANRDGVDMAVDKKPFIMGEQYYQETFKKD